MSRFESELGNAIVPPKFLNFEKMKGIQGKYWKCNYHLKEDESFEYVFKKLEFIMSFCSSYIFCEEHGNSGNTRHIEGGFITREDRKRWTSIMNVFQFSDLQRSKRKNWKALVSYCSKEHIKYGYKLIKSDNVKIKKPLKKLPCQDNMHKWQEKILEIIKSEIDDRTIYWITGKHCGEGKTIFCKYLVRFHGAIMLNGKSSDMKQGIMKYYENNDDTPELILCNIPKSFDCNYLSYTGIEEIKDMLFYSPKYEGGMIDGNNPHLIIFSNDIPDYDKLDKKRWKHYIIDDKKDMFEVVDI